MGNWFLFSFFFFLVRGTGFHLGWAIGEDRPGETLQLRPEGGGERSGEERMRGVAAGRAGRSCGGAETGGAELGGRQRVTAAPPPTHTRSAQLVPETCLFRRVNIQRRGGEQVDTELAQSLPSPVCSSLDDPLGVLVKAQPGSTLSEGWMNRSPCSVTLQLCEGRPLG